MNEQNIGAPIFVKVEEYKEILDVLDMIKDKIKEIKTTLGAVNTLRNDEDAEIDNWSKTIDDIEKKIDYIDKLVFEPEQTM